MEKKFGRLLGLTLTVSCLPIWAAGDGHHGFDWGNFAAHVINAAIFFGTLYWLLRKPVSAFFSQRLKTIREDLDLAEKSRKEAKKRLDEIESKMASLQQELEQIENQAREDAERERQRITEEAKREAERIIEQARAEVENARRQAILELKAYTANLAMEEAETIIRETISDEERKQLFARFSARLGADR